MSIGLIVQDMSTRKPLKKHQKRVAKNEWLSVVADLDELMAKQAAEESRKPMFGKGIVEAVNSAYPPTLRYYTSLLEGGKRNPKAEREISRLWQKAGAGIRKCDPVLANRLKGTNAFWVNDVTWERDTIQEAWARLNSIRVNANMLAPDVDTITRWSTFSSS